MKEKTDHKKCLVLNADFSPIGIISWRKAIIWQYQYTMHDKSSIDIVEYYTDDFIQGACETVKVPAVVKTARYFNIYSAHHVVFSRKNIFIRDDYSCQYCGVRPRISQLTYDHVIPKSKWQYDTSPTSWENIVTCCVKCNRRKSNKMLNQTDLKLRKKPIRPKKSNKYLPITHELHIIRDRIPEEWTNYLKGYT